MNLSMKIVLFLTSAFWLGFILLAGCDHDRGRQPYIVTSHDNLMECFDGCIAVYGSSKSKHSRICMDYCFYKQQTVACREQLDALEMQRMDANDAAE